MFAKAIAFVTTWWKFILAAVAAVSLAFLLGQCDGRKSERAVQEAATQKARAEGLERARVADEQRRAEVGNSNIAINQAREDLDNATRNLPDESPTARRRARVCAELRDAARRRGTAAPAC